MKNKLIILLLCNIIIISCKPLVEHPNEYIHFLNPANEPLHETPSYNSVKIIKLETSPNCLIDNIKRIEMNDSLIFIQDFHHLYMFTNKGKFITEIGKKGEAPNEYIALNTFYLDEKKKQICIIDDFKNLIIKYDLKGKHIISEPVPRNALVSCNYALTAGDNKLLIFHMLDMDDTNAYSIFDFNKKGANEYYFSYQPITVGDYIYTFSTHPMTKSGKDINIIMPLCDTIFTYLTESSSFQPKYIIETPQKMASKNQIRKNTPYYTDDICKLAEQGYFIGFTGIFETDKKVLLEYREQGIVLGFFLFDKESKTGNYYLSVSKDNTEIIPFFTTIHSYKNVFVGYERAENLINFKNIKDDKIQACINSLKEDDNPCLFLYQLK